MRKERMPSSVIVPALTRLKMLGPDEQEKVFKILRSNTYRNAVGPISEAVGFECSAAQLQKFWRARMVPPSERLDAQRQRILMNRLADRIAELIWKRMIGQFKERRRRSTLADKNEFEKLTSIYGLKHFLEQKD